jgi:hypothetical protein
MNRWRTVLTDELWEYNHDGETTFTKPKFPMNKLGYIYTKESTTNKGDIERCVLKLKNDGFDARKRIHKKTNKDSFYRIEVKDNPSRLTKTNSMDVIMADDEVKFIVRLPITESYDHFIRKYGWDTFKDGVEVLDQLNMAYDYNVEGLYRLNFEDGQYYIGGTRNIVSVIHNTCTLNDVTNPDKISLKSARIKLAIDNCETVCFELLDEDIKDKYEIVKGFIGQVGCLNMKASSI